MDRNTLRLKILQIPTLITNKKEFDISSIFVRFKVRKGGFTNVLPSG